MVGAVDAVDAAVAGAARIVGMADALDQQWQPGQRAQPREVVPGQRVAEDRHPFQDRGLRILLRRLRQARPGTPGHWCSWTGSARAAAGSSTSSGRGAATRHPGVQRHDDALVSGRLGALHEAGRQIAVRGRVQLEKPWGVPEFGGTSSSGSAVSVDTIIGTPVRAAAWRRPDRRGRPGRRCR